MTKAKIAIIEKFGKKFKLVNPEKDISLEKLCEIFGERTIKVNSFNSSIFQIEALNGIENHINIEDIKNSEWEEIEIN
jgi:hypothetical protein